MAGARGPRHGRRAAHAELRADGERVSLSVERRHGACPRLISKVFDFFCSRHWGGVARAQTFAIVPMPVRERPRPVGRVVAVAADESSSGLRQAELGVLSRDEPWVAHCRCRRG